MKTQGNNKQSKLKSNAKPAKTVALQKAPDVRSVANAHWKSQHRSFSGLQRFIAQTEAKGGGKKHFSDLVKAQAEKTGITVTPAMMFSGTGELLKALDTKRRIFWDKAGKQKTLLSYWEVIANGVGRVARFYKNAHALATAEKITVDEARKRLIADLLKAQAAYAAQKEADKVKAAA